MVDESGNLAILISSYDGSEDLWRPLSNSFKKYWPDCPYKIFIGTNNKKPDSDIFFHLPIGEEKSWSDNIIKCLECISENNILLTFDNSIISGKDFCKTI